MVMDAFISVHKVEQVVKRVVNKLSPATLSSDPWCSVPNVDASDEH